MLGAYLRSGYRAEDPNLDYDKLTESEKQKIDAAREFNENLEFHTKKVPNYPHDPSKHFQCHFAALINSKLERGNATIGIWFHCCMLDALMIFVDPETGATLDPHRMTLDTHVCKDKEAEVDILICTSKSLLRDAALEAVKVQIDSFEGVLKSKGGKPVNLRDLEKERNRLLNVWVGRPFQIHEKRSLRERWKQIDRDAGVAVHICYPKPITVALFDREYVGHSLERSKELALHHLRHSVYIDEFYTANDSESMFDLFCRIVNS